MYAITFTRASEQAEYEILASYARDLGLELVQKGSEFEILCNSFYALMAADIMLDSKLCTIQKIITKEESGEKTFERFKFLEETRDFLVLTQQLYPSGIAEAFVNWMEKWILPNSAMFKLPSLIKMNNTILAKLEEFKKKEHLFPTGFFDKCYDALK